MENKKDLGKLFEEQLTNIDASPNEMLWERIEKTMNRRKRTRLYLIWLFSLLGLLLGILFIVPI